MNRLRLLTVGSFALVCMLLACAVRAELVVYTIDQAQSSLLITGNLTSNIASPQTSGSTITSYTGTIVADRQAGSISFPGGSNVDATPQPVNQQPRADATPGSAPADYGRIAPGPFGSTTFEAIRNLRLDIEDDTSGIGVPLSGSSFPSNSLVVVISDGESDAIYGLGSAEVSLFNKAAANGSGQGPSSVELVGFVETLTLKISSGPIAYGVSQTADSTIAFSGTIVATREIPEPAGMAVLTLMLWVAMRPRRGARAS